MYNLNLCSPALLYLAFSLTHVIIDTFNGLYNTASIKIAVSIIIALVLNVLCDRGLTTIAWIIVFIPFVFLTALVGIVLYALGIDATTGPTISGITRDASGNIIVYDPEYNPSVGPVYYKSPNIVIPNPQSNDIVIPTPIVTHTPIAPPRYFPVASSSLAYQS